jgi:predicted phosphohydrolase
MSLFAIADLHLSFGANKSMEIFPGWENYTERIEKNWRKVVKPEDTVVIAGDVSWAMSLKELPPDFDFLQSLPGKKLIIKGNHDYWWDTMSKMSKFATNGGYDNISFIHNNAKMVSGVGVCGTRGWFNDGSEDRKILLREVGRLETSIAIAEKAGVEPVVFLHYPPICAGYYCSEIMDVLKSHGVRRCYYGHLHGRATTTAIEGEHEGIIFRLISCDRTDFAPAIVENDVD